MGVASLQIAASDAKAAQQRVETELAKQQVLALDAEKDVIELQKRIQPRMIRGEKRDAFLRTVRDGPKGAVLVMCVVGDIETCLLADDVRTMLGANGSDTGKQLFSMLHMMAENTPVGITLFVKDLRTMPAGANTLKAALVNDAGLAIEIKENTAMQNSDVMELSELVVHQQVQQQISITAIVLLPPSCQPPDLGRIAHQ